MSRYLVWFSAGAPSAVAAKLTLAKHDDVEIVYIDTGSEHDDNRRFIADCERWFRHPVTVAKSTHYGNTWDVWERTGYLVGPTGARCTAELKKKVRFRIQRPDDVQVYGYTADLRDMQRAIRFREQNPEVLLSTPLIDQGLTKGDVLAMVDRAGIRIPAMYELGYQNNNCIGCVKGGIGYWNKIRHDFPDVFDRMAKLERDKGATVLREDSRRFTDDHAIWLDELDPERGDYPTEQEIDCSLLCVLAESAYSESARSDQPQDGA